MNETTERAPIETSVDRPFDWVAALAVAAGAVVTVTSIGALVVALVAVLVKFL
jgi:hypothetical protein